MYVYLKATGLYCVGFFGPTGEWISESDYVDIRFAAERVHYLNGGEVPHVELAEQAAFDKERERQRLDMFAAAALTAILSRVDPRDGKGFYIYFAVSYAQEMVRQLNAPLSSPPEPPEGDTY